MFDIPPGIAHSVALSSQAETVLAIFTIVVNMFGLLQLIEIWRARSAAGNSEIYWVLSSSNSIYWILDGISLDDSSLFYSSVAGAMVGLLIASSLVYFWILNRFYGGSGSRGSGGTDAAYSMVEIIVDQLG